MFKKEKIENGVLYSRSDINEPWKMVSYRELLARFLDEQNDNQTLREIIHQEKNEIQEIIFRAEELNNAIERYMEDP